jgi:hypothetical protein
MTDKDKFRKMLQMELPVRRVQRYSTSQPWNAGKTSITFHLDVDFRPTHILTNLVESNKAFLTQLFVGDSSLSELCAVVNGYEYSAVVDGYEYSADLKQKLQQAFYKEHGLEGKSFDQIDRYLDDHEISPPDPNRIELPSIHKGGMVRFAGYTSVDFIISLLGAAVV